MTTTVYVAGPMSGIEDHNFPAFAAAVADLRSRGLTVISPAELTLAAYGTLEEAAKVSWEVHLARDLVAVIERADEVYCLPGWRSSKGATLEVHVAKALGRPVNEYATAAQPDRCPCACNCHVKVSCDHPVTDEQRARETLGVGGQYVCGWCYSVCEGDDY